MEECDEFCKQPNIMLDEVWYDTEEDAKRQPYNTNIIPNVSVLLQYKEYRATGIDNSRCMTDSNGSRMFQNGQNKFGY